MDSWNKRGLRSRHARLSIKGQMVREKSIRLRGFMNKLVSPNAEKKMSIFAGLVELIQEAMGTKYFAIARRVAVLR